MSDAPASGDWIAHNGHLCLSGHPIWIERGKPGQMPFLLCAEGCDRSAYGTLRAAKRGGEELAREIAEFQGEAETHPEKPS